MVGNTFIWSVYGTLKALCDVYCSDNLHFSVTTIFLIISTFFAFSGLLKKEPKIWSCNVFGLALALYYCSIFVGNIGKGKSPDHKLLDISTPTLPGSVRQHVQAVTAVIVGILSLAILKPFGSYSETLIGNIGVAICVLMFASPLSVIKLVLEKKSARSIPLPFTVLTTVNCFMWTVFGWFAMKDVNVYLPNFLGLVSGMVQVLLKLVYGNDKDVLPIVNASIAAAP
jgi:uncharacterized protein with PQ loop repeat